MITNQNHGVTKTLDLDAVQAFVLVATFTNFTRAAEASGTTQSAVSLKLKRLEARLERRLVERSPRSVRLTADGEAFLVHANELLAANERALSISRAPEYRLRVGISDHVAGAELPAIFARLNKADPGLRLEASIGFSRPLLDAFDDGDFDGVIVRPERSRRDGEAVLVDNLAWFAAPSYRTPPDEPMRVANLAPPCGVRAVAIRALDAARIPWQEVFLGGGVAALSAAVSAGVAVGAFARRVAPADCVEVTEQFRLPPLPPTTVMLYSRVSDIRSKSAFRVLSASLRGAA